MKRVAIVGTVGLPASYGGFESLVENLVGDKKSKDIGYTVFCSSRDLSSHIKEYKGAQLKYIPLKANGIQSIPYDILSILRVSSDTDTILVLGVSGCIILPFFRIFSKKRIVVNIDGLEHRRDKWGKVARSFLKLSEKIAINNSDVIIADNKGIKDYVKEEYGKDSALIAYGGDHVIREIDMQYQTHVLDKWSLCKNNYAITVCRIEPENNCHLILDAFSRSDKKLVFVGNWDHSDYGKALKNKYGMYSNIIMSNPIYDIDLLYVLRHNAGIYVHGHSAGGTNPSLVEAMFFGHPILCYDVVYNRESTHGQAYYWKDVNQLLSLILRDDLSGDKMRSIAETEYTWKTIVTKYESLY